MNLELSAADLAFQAEVRAFLSDNLPPDLQVAGRRMTSVFVEKQYSIPWQKILHAKGWVAPSWPVEYGGCGWDEMQRYIFQAECARAGAPGLSPMGLRMTKEGLNLAIDAPSLEAAMAIENRNQLMTAASPNFAEGMAAVLEKRSPQYKPD